MMEKTRWYPKDVDPVRIGWYERFYEAVDSFPEEVYMDWWSGTCWFMEYVNGKCYSPSMTRRPWRGMSYPTLTLS